MRLARLCLAISTLAAVACASTGQPATELIVEGGQESYAAFEAAAAGCGFSTLKRESDGLGGTHIHLYDIRYPLRPAAKCALAWVSQHPEAKLILSAH